MKRWDPTHPLWPYFAENSCVIFEGDGEEYLAWVSRLFANTPELDHGNGWGYLGKISESGIAHVSVVKNEIHFIWDGFFPVFGSGNAIHFTELPDDDWLDTVITGALT